MRKVVLAFEQQATQDESSHPTLPLIPINQERTLVRVKEIIKERVKERAKLASAEKSLEPSTALAQEAATFSTPTQTTLPPSQHDPTTPTTTNTLLLLTTGPRFDKTTSDGAKPSASHTEKLPFDELSRTHDNVLPNAAKVQMDLILANQQTIMAN